MPCAIRPDIPTYCRRTPLIQLLEIGFANIVSSLSFTFFHLQEQNAYFNNIMEPSFKSIEKATKRTIQKYLTARSINHAEEVV
jgi:hypothetical protein